MPEAVEHGPELDGVACGLVHLLAAKAEHPVVHPDVREVVPEGPRLGNLVLVMGKDEVETAAVDLEARAEMLLGHRGALDVPAGSAVSPGGGPPGVLSGLVGLPEREVALILLPWIRLLFPDLVELLTGEATVVGEARDTEVDVPIGLVREPVPDQLLDHPDLLRHRPRSRRLGVRPPEPESARVVQVPPCRSLGEAGALAGRGVVDLVVDVGDVDHQRGLVARSLEPALQPHREHERDGVADVDALVDGRPAEVHADRPGRAGQWLQRPRQGVVQAHPPIVDGVPRTVSARHPLRRRAARVRSPRPPGGRRRRSRARAHARPR